MWRVGVGPFLDGLRRTSPWAVLTVVGLTVLTTACSAWRWRLIARGLGAELPMSAAVGWCYRSQFLNATLPGGVLGDVHRGLRHAKGGSEAGRGMRSVAWERMAGQIVHLALTATVLLVLASRTSARLVILTGLALGVVVGVLAVAGGRHVGGAPEPATSPPPAHEPTDLSGASRFLHTLREDLSSAVLTRRSGPAIVLASLLALAGYVAVFAVAVRSAGAQVPPGRMLILAVVVLQVAALPTNIAGWGPREGASAWAFGAAGLGATTGITVAVVYGVLALLASTPGAVLLASDLITARRRGPSEGHPTHQGPLRVAPVRGGIHA